MSKVSGYALTGCSRSMFANRISYTFDFQGPSYAMDTACSSSFLAFQQAILGLRTGQCDQAIVGGVNICLRPVTALQFHKLNMLSPDGKCKYLDAEASKSISHLDTDTNTRKTGLTTSFPLISLLSSQLSLSLSPSKVLIPS